MMAIEAESDWFITARAFSSPLLCHNAGHFIRKQRSVLLAVSFKAFLVCLRTVKMGLTWSSYKSKRKEKKDYKRYVKFLSVQTRFSDSQRP